MADAAGKQATRRNAVLFGVLAVAWFALDRATKAWAAGGEVGGLLGAGLPGVFEFRLVHNTGAAWGVFGGSTFALGVFAVVFCLLLLAVAALRARKAPAAEMAGYALVLAGGIGNAVDRFTDGYVVDFICATFVDFPVFNVADIGVTCGFALVIVFYFLDARRTGAASGSGEA